MISKQSLWRFPILWSSNGLFYSKLEQSRSRSRRRARTLGLFPRDGCLICLELRWCDADLRRDRQGDTVVVVVVRRSEEGSTKRPKPRIHFFIFILRCIGKNKLQQVLESILTKSSSMNIKFSEAEKEGRSILLCMWITMYDRADKDRWYSQHVLL